MNSVVMLTLLAVVLAPFLGIVYSILDAWSNAPAAPAEFSDTHGA
jgi:hypothetical protein